MEEVVQSGGVWDMRDNWIESLVVKCCPAHRYHGDESSVLSDHSGCLVLFMLGERLLGPVAGKKPGVLHRSSATPVRRRWS